MARCVGARFAVLLSGICATMPVFSAPQIVDFGELDVAAVLSRVGLSDVRRSDDRSWMIERISMPELDDPIDGYAAVIVPSRFSIVMRVLLPSGSRARAYQVNQINRRLMGVGGCKALLVDAELAVECSQAFAGRITEKRFIDFVLNGILSARAAQTALSQSR